MKVFVLVPYIDRSNEEIDAIRQDALDKISSVYVGNEDVELSLPKGKRLTGDIEAMFAADVIVKVRFANYDPVCQLVEQTAHVYGKYVVEDNILPHEINDELLESVRNA